MFWLTMTVLAFIIGGWITLLGWFEHKSIRENVYIPPPRKINLADFD